ncbi:MAG TPA: hypothetical protein VMB72_01295 [Acidimicrobiales bacterium]|nr:hypothetical protein [Acidimicrobiales bacterium]
MFGRLPHCPGIVVVHHDQSMTCTQESCRADDELYPRGSEGWLLAHAAFYGCDAVLRHCPRCAQPSSVAS